MSSGGDAGRAVCGRQVESADYHFVLCEVASTIW